MEAISAKSGEKALPFGNSQRFSSARRFDGGGAQGRGNIPIFYIKLQIVEDRFSFLSKRRADELFKFGLAARQDRIVFVRDEAHD